MEAATILRVMLAPQLTPWTMAHHDVDEIGNGIFDIGIGCGCSNFALQTVRAVRYPLCTLACSWRKRGCDCANYKTCF